jgi:DNA-directed RNA polymerase subunit M/transcription elongation factor TFIIS
MMINLGSQIDRIEALLKEGTPSSVTYAALESRLTIELICYERLKTAYGYTSYSELRKWQPKDVVEQVAQEANPLATSGFTVSVSRTSIDNNRPPQSVADYEEFDYETIGTQIGFDTKKVGKLWHSLSHLALHVRLPKNQHESLSAYREAEEITIKVQEALDLFREIDKGTLLASSPGPEVSFQCSSCGTTIKRKQDLVHNGRVINCPSPSCRESYVVIITELGIEFGRRVLPVACDQCGTIIEVALSLVESLRADQMMTAECQDCGSKVRIRLIPCTMRNSAT